MLILQRKWTAAALLVLFLTADPSVMAQSGEPVDAHRNRTLTESSKSPDNIAFRIEGKSVHLINGRNERQAAPGSASKIITAIFGDRAVGDLDDDGMPDVALTLRQQTGGTGTFVYVAAAMRRKGGFYGTNGVFIGDRIKVERLSIQNNVIVIRYLDRKPGVPMAGRPDLAKRMCLVSQNGELQQDTCPE